jgi:hypothetical protein
MKSVPEKPATMQVALSTILAFVVGLCATRVTLVIGERYRRETWPFAARPWLRGRTLTRMFNWSGANCRARG